MDDNSAEDINQVARAVIELGNKYDVTAEVGQTIVVKEVDENGTLTATAVT